MIRRHPIIFLALSLLLTGCENSPEIVQESRFLMGTMVSIKAPSSAAIEKSFFRVKEVADLMNKYDSKSECAFINRLKAGETIKISTDMAFVIKKALELNQITRGAFDVTISPLVDLWSSTKETRQVPSKKEILLALSKVSSKYILLRDDGTLRFSSQGTNIDLSGLAKGYVVDKAVEVLKKNGIKNGLVDAGGDIYCLGSGPHREGWRIGVKHPRGAGLIGMLTLTDKAVATSGDYQKYYTINKHRYSHLIDPRIGYPVSEIPMSVTVIAPDCVTADGLATAISIMGPQEGLRLIERLEAVEAIIISKDEGELRIDTTSGIKDVYKNL